MYATLLIVSLVAFTVAAAADKHVISIAESNVRRDIAGKTKESLVDFLKKNPKLTAHETLANWMIGDDKEQEKFRRHIARDVAKAKASEAEFRGGGGGSKGDLSREVHVSSMTSSDMNAFKKKFGKTGSESGGSGGSFALNKGVASDVNSDVGAGRRRRAVVNRRAAPETTSMMTKRDEESIALETSYYTDRGNGEREMVGYFDNRQQEVVTATFPACPAKALKQTSDREVWQESIACRNESTGTWMSTMAIRQFDLPRDKDTMMSGFEVTFTPGFFQNSFSGLFFIEVMIHIDTERGQCSYCDGNGANFDAFVVLTEEELEEFTFWHFIISPKQFFDPFASTSSGAEVLTLGVGHDQPFQDSDESLFLGATVRDESGPSYVYSQFCGDQLFTNEQVGFGFVHWQLTACLTDMRPPRSWTCNLGLWETGFDNACEACACGAWEPLDCAGVENGHFDNTLTCSPTKEWCVYPGHCEPHPVAEQCPSWGDGAQNSFDCYWTYFGTDDGCDCACAGPEGVGNPFCVDPDCLTENGPVYNCEFPDDPNTEVSCPTGLKCEYEVPEPPCKGWGDGATNEFNCLFRYYDAQDGCDCACSTDPACVDPDCLTDYNFVFNCPSMNGLTETCSGDGSKCEYN